MASIHGADLNFSIGCFGFHRARGVCPLARGRQGRQGFLVSHGGPAHGNIKGLGSIGNPTQHRLICASNVSSSKDGMAAVPRNLYGSRTSIGLELLQLLRSAPDLHRPEPAPQPGASACSPEAAGSRSPGPYLPSEDATAPPPVLQEAAALVLEVSGLMLSHRDMSNLGVAMERCSAQINTVRRVGPDAAAGGGGGGRGEGAFRGAGTSRFGGGFEASARLRGQLSGKIGVDADGLAGVHGGGQPESVVPAHLNTSPEGCARVGQPAAGLHSGPEQLWDWAAVRRLVVIGLGSLASYQEALRSGRQTERESTRVAARLYQLALSRVLGSPTVLPGLSSQVQAPSHQPQTQPESGRDEVSGPTTPPPPVAETAESSAVAAGRSQPALQYFDPEYRPWDLELVHAVWQSGYLQPGGYPAPASPTNRSCNDPQGAVECAPPCEGQSDDTSAWLGATAQQPPASQPSDCRRPTTVAATALPADVSALVATEPTLFYAPCCPRELYDEIVRHNLAAGTLRNVALVGNSLKAQADSAMLMRAFGGFMAPPPQSPSPPLPRNIEASGGPSLEPRGLGAASAARAGSGGGSGGIFDAGPRGSRSGSRPGLREEDAGGEEVFVGLVGAGRVVEVMLPDFAAHGVATCLHLFA